MTRIYISLDLETTGLDPEHDRIIEVGAVRFRGDRILDEFQTLVNPNYHIPYQVQHLTGISNDDVADAPQFRHIRGALQRFVGNAPIIGHNIQFDLAFLNKQGLFTENPSIDTFEIASILLPHADRYSLKALAHLLGIAEPATHRALDDARVAHRLFESLLNEARRLDPRIIKDVAEMATRSKWSLAPVFKDLARQGAGRINSVLAREISARRAEIFGSDELTPLPEPRTPPQKLNIDALASLLEPGGKMEKAMPGFEHRPQQVAMLRAVTEAFNEPYHLMVEAGTGTGKSMAYLLPAIHWAIQNNSRVVISTNTINLQDQILHKDLPALKKALNLDFRAAALKGRGNYVCQYRVEQFRKKENLSPTEMRLLAKIMVWLPNTTTGDRQELFLPDYTEQALWGQVNANADLCPPDRCAREQCFFFRARQAAEAAHVLVVNHALLLADISVGNRAIPEYRYLVIDEAHHLENSITRQLSFSANEKTIFQLLSSLIDSTTNPAAHMRRQIRKAGLNNLLSDIESLATKTQAKATATRQAVQTLFNTLQTFMADFGKQQNNQYDRKLRISPQMRVQPGWSDVEMAWDNTDLLLADLDKLLTKAQKLWDGLDTYDVADWEETAQSLATVRLMLDEMRENLRLILAEDNKDIITWMEEKVRTQDISLHAAPLHVGNLVRQHLFDQKESVVLTSATMRTDNSFDYIKERLGAWDIAELSVGSPFDYKNSTLVFVPTNIPEPNTAGFQKAFEETLINLAIATDGRVLVLFTAYSHLRNTANGVRRPLAEHDIVLYQQGTGASRRQLLENFKTAEKAVLLGTRSFWEGVDVPGDDLSVVVIAKIPFAVPSDPIFQARSETFDDAFMQYSIPEAILHFRQGFGRLIRTRDDRGVVVIMDKRVLTKRYGKAFLDSLPDATIRRGLSTDLPQAAAEWIAKTG